MQSWLEGTNWVEKCAHTTGMTASLRILSLKADSNTWESWSWSQFIKSHHTQTSSGKGIPSHFWNRNIVRRILPGLRRKITGLLLSGPKSSFQMKVNFDPRVWRKSGEAQNPCCLKSSVKFSQSVMIWAAMSSAGVGPLCFLKSTVNAAIHHDIIKHFMLPSADKLYGDADFIFQQDLAPAHSAKGTKSWFNDHGVTVLDWPANSPDLNPKENLYEEYERHQTQQCRWPEGRYFINLYFITPEQCRRLIASMPRRIDAVIHAKGGQPNIECIETNILFRSLTFLFKISFFYWLYVLF